MAANVVEAVAAYLVALLTSDHRHLVEIPADGADELELLKLVDDRSDGYEFIEPEMLGVVVDFGHFLDFFQEAGIAGVGGVFATAAAVVRERDDLHELVKVDLGGTLLVRAMKSVGGLLGLCCLLLELLEASLAYFVSAC